MFNVYILRYLQFQKIEVVKNYMLMKNKTNKKKSPTLARLIVRLLMCPSQSQAALVVLIPADTKAQWSGMVRGSHIRRYGWIRLFLNHFLLSPWAARD